MLIQEFIYAVAIAVPIGMLAIVDQYLTSFSFKYTGKELGPAFANRTINIEYCQWNEQTFQNSSNSNNKMRCNLAYAAPAVSLVLTLAAIVFKQKTNALIKRVGDFHLAAAGLLLWATMAIIFSVWAHQANSVGNPGYDWRNTYAFFAWFLALAFAAQTCMTFLMLSIRMQRWIFGPSKPKAPRRTAAAAPPQQQLPVRAPAPAASPPPSPRPAASGGGAPAVAAGASGGGAKAAAAPAGADHLPLGAGELGQHGAWASGTPRGEADVEADPANPFRAAEPAK